MNSTICKYLLIALLSFISVIPVTQAKVVATTSMSIVRVDRNPHQLIDRARQLYHNEQYAEASRIWQQAVTVFEQQEDRLNQAMALSNLALTQQKLGDLTAAEQAIELSLKLLQSQSQTVTQQRILANSLDIKGSILRSRGQSQLAFDTWLQAEKIYQQLDNPRAIVKNQVLQAQALQDLGYYRRASQILTSIQTKLDLEPDSEPKIFALLSLGNLLRATGNLEQSQIVLQQAGAIADRLNAIEQKTAVLLSLGNTVRALGNRVDSFQTLQTENVPSPQCLVNHNLSNKTTYYLQAEECYQQAALSSEGEIKIKAQLNLLSLAIENQDKEFIARQSSISDLIAKIKTNLAQLPVTRTTIFDRLNLVQSLICLQPNTLEFPSPLVQQCQPLAKGSFNISWAEIEAEINIALAQADRLKDKPAQAYALGYLGGIYQQTGRLTQAEQLTEQALLTIDSTTTPEISYLWQWQLGRIYQLQNQREKALLAYKTTFEVLQFLRQNLVAINPEIQFTFRDRIEPVYRERVALLLQNNNPSQENLRQARDTIEALQLAELNNFFREACLDATPQKIEQIDPKAAVIYSIILTDRLAVILSQAGQPLQYYQTILNPNEIDRTFEDLYANLNSFLSTTDLLKANQTLYNWLIRPLESQLEQNKPNTLVFILDGIMRGIPVASLHDGKQYLIEKYNLALTPGLQLLTSPSLTSDPLKTIAGGLSEPRQGFSSLPNVETELSEISTLVPAEVLLDEKFTRDRLQAQIKTSPYPIVHLATHGQFSSRPEDTFLLTWDDRINVKDLDRLLQERDFAEDTPIELLILSACQTAAGDTQAALGLAGVAVRSGARSTVATLWSIQDNSTAELMTQFYRVLKNSEISKAEALRQAQLSLLRDPKYQHPFYWSAFVLVGNWL
ncbi:MAG: CHAT domain-containing protein [Xenococcaceae cyanobacterium]